MSNFSYMRAIQQLQPHQIGQGVGTLAGGLAGYRLGQYDTYDPKTGLPRPLTLAERLGLTAGAAGAGYIAGDLGGRLVGYKKYL